jgi:hypothetical protein
MEVMKVMEVMIGDLLPFWPRTADHGPGVQTSRHFRSLHRPPSVDDMYLSGCES